MWTIEIKTENSKEWLPYTTETTFDRAETIVSMLKENVAVKAIQVTKWVIESTSKWRR